MKPRHAAALALVGWYLMAPPRFPKDKSPYALDASAPLSRWHSINSFDSAVECKAEKTRLTDSHNETLGAIGMASNCIASDDPRLKPK